MLAYAYGSATIAVLVLASWAAGRDFARHADALAAAAMLAMVFSADLILGQYYSPPECWRFNRFIDVACTFAAFMMWRRNHARWKAVLLIAFALQVVLDAAFWLSDKSAWAQYLYPRLLNPFYVVQLLVVASPGGGVLGGVLVDFMRGHRGADPAALRG